MGDQGNKSKGGDSLGGEIDPKTRSGPDAITSAKDGSGNRPIDRNKDEADSDVGKAELNTPREDRF